MSGGRPKGTRALALKIQLAARDGARCFYCRAPFTALEQATLDHYLPLRMWRKAAARNSLPNLVLACAPCNNRKGDTLPVPLALMVLAARDHFERYLDANPKRKTWPKARKRRIATDKAAYYAAKDARRAQLFQRGVTDDGGPILDPAYEHWLINNGVDPVAYLDRFDPADGWETPPWAAKYAPAATRELVTA